MINYKPNRPTLFKANAGEDVQTAPPVPDLNALQMEVTILRHKLARERMEGKLKIAAGFCGGIAAILILLFIIKLLKNKQMEV